MDLTSLLLPKKSKKEVNKEATIEQPKYPYGFQLRFDSEQIDKLPQLEKVKIGEKVNVQAIGEVMEVRKVDRQNDKKQFSVEIQLQQIGVESTSTKKEKDTLIGAIERSKKGLK